MMLGYMNPKIQSLERICFVHVGLALQSLPSAKMQAELAKLPAFLSERLLKRLDMYRWTEDCRRAILEKKELYSTQIKESKDCQYHITFMTNEVPSDPLFESPASFFFWLRNLRTTVMYGNKTRLFPMNSSEDPATLMIGCDTVRAVQWPDGSVCRVKSLTSKRVRKALKHENAKIIPLTSSKITLEIGGFHMPVMRNMIMQPLHTLDSKPAKTRELYSEYNEKLNELIKVWEEYFAWCGED